MLVSLVHKFVIVVSFVCVLLAGCEQQPEIQRHEISGQTMGTYYKISIIDEADVALKSINSALAGTLEEINTMMSTYIAESQISRFNSSGSDGWFEVSRDLAFVSRNALDIYQQTNGLFDPTIAPLVNLWSFGPDQKPSGIPTDEDLAMIRDSIGGDKLQIRDQPPALKKSTPSVRLDLSAIAKGFAVDRIAEYLISQGLPNFLIDIGGELRAGGTNLTGQPWRVGIEKPQTQTTQTIQQVISISERSIATSGSYRNYFEQDNKRYSHIINPETGYPIEHKLVSVSVISDNCMMADGYATALMVLGPQRGFDFALQYGLAVYMIEKKGDEFVSRFTPQMEPFME